jgi:hypothetical protein
MLAHMQSLRRHAMSSQEGTVLFIALAAGMAGWGAAQSDYVMVTVFALAGIVGAWGVPQSAQTRHEGCRALA